MKKIILIFGIAMTGIYLLWPSKKIPSTSKKLEIQQIKFKELAKVQKHEVKSSKSEISWNEYQESEHSFDKKLKQLEDIVGEMSKFDIRQGAPESLLNEFEGLKNELIRDHKKLLTQSQLLISTTNE